MPSITSWARLEPSCRSEAIDRGLEARVQDPLWTLARQWQFGEFRGEDAGSPIVASFRAEALPISRYQLGPNGTARPYDGTVPLEALVERETVLDPGAHYRLAVQTGLQWLRMLAAAGATATTLRAYIEELRIDRAAPQTQVSDDAGRAFLAVTRRVPDGVRLRERLRAWRRAGAGSDTLPGIAAAGSERQRTKVAERVDEWLRWYESLFSEPQRQESAWIPSRMEYQFAVGAKSGPDELVLAAREYTGGHLDWYSFSLESGRTLGGPDNTRVNVVTETAIPSAATFRGMPAPRWWEFEDAQIDFGFVAAEPDDLGRLVLIEFALVYGNDWFVVPVEVPVGTVCVPRSLVVTDTFGVRTLVRHYTVVDGDASGWRMFSLTPPARSPVNAPDREALFLPPAIIGGLDAPPLEEVLFVRDDMANMAWAVERVIAGMKGQPVRRFELYQARREEARREADLNRDSSDASQQPDALRYRLADEVPDYWIPLLPERTERASIQLRRGSLLAANGSRTPVPSLGRILAPSPLVMFDEEVPQSGVRVTRGFQYARWIDGSTHVWLARHKRPGRGEGSSGLRFDTARAGGVS